MNIIDTYKERVNRFEAIALDRHRKSRQISWLRLIVFIGGIITAYLSLSLSPVAAGLILILSVALFLLLVKWHERIKKQGSLAENKAEINRLEIDYSKQVFGSKSGGNQYLDVKHPYAIDLDIFGSFSIFQAVDRTVTIPGQTMLAKRMQSALDSPVISEIQDSVKELSENPDWRQTFQAHGFSIKDQSEGLAKLQKWLKEKPALQSRKMRLILLVVPVVAIIGTILILSFLKWQWLLLLYALPGIILYQNFKTVNKIQYVTESGTAFLKAFGQLFKLIEDTTFHSRHLNSLTARLDKYEGKNVSAIIGLLGYRVSQLNVRQNPFSFVLNLFGLWEIQWAKSIEDWKIRYGESVSSWFEVLGEFDVIQSVGALHFNHPEWCFPEITQEDQIVTKKLGHPLISSAENIKNDLQIQTRSSLHLITGSNMSGKSTFLRSVGTNMVLAYMGAPVCADFFKLPVLQVYTSMRTQDALAEHTSSFYAELRRLKQILDAIKSGNPCFIFLDEILKGTNSADRHTGTRALLNQLLRLKCAGLVATHDLDLTDLEKESGGQVENWSFEVSIEGQKMIFDYTIKRGVCQSFNATLLMSQMGFDV